MKGDSDMAKLAKAADRTPCQTKSAQRGGYSYHEYAFMQVRLLLSEQN